MLSAMSRAALILLACVAPALATGAEPVARVTTDSRDYCHELAQRLAPLPGAHQEPARSLAEDGMRLCGSGHVRAGVARLRRAIRAAQLAH
jgi:hypothetical protein